MANKGSIRQRNFIEFLMERVFYEYIEEYELEKKIPYNYMHYDLKIRDVCVGVSAYESGKINIRVYNCDEMVSYLTERGYSKKINGKSYQKFVPNANYLSDIDGACDLVLKELQAIIDYILTNIDHEEIIEEPISTTSHRKHRRQKLNFNLPSVDDYDFESFNCDAFYTYIEEKFEERTSEVGVNELSKYYNPDVANYINDSEIRNTLKQVFAELLLHCQNRTGMKSIRMIPPHNMVVAYSNYDHIKEATYGFDYNKFKEKYEQLGDEAINHFIEKMHIGDSKPSINFVKYAKAYADYLSTLGNITREQFIDIYKEFNQDIHELYTNFKANVKKGFGVALTCDFFKELSSDVFDIPKPDLWVNRVISRLTGDSFLEYNTDETNLLSANILKKISTLCNGEGKTAYKLDKMIYLLCTKKLYLDGNVRMNSSIEDIFKEGNFHLNKLN